MTEVITFEQFVASESRRLWKGNHHKKSVAKAAKFGAFANFSIKHISDYKPMQIHQLLDYLKDTLKQSDNTANHYAPMIAKVFNHAVEGEIITHSPKFKWKDKADTSHVVYFSRAQTDAAEAFFANHQESWMQPILKPMLCPPTPWTSFNTGCYKDPFLASKNKLVRGVTKAQQSAI